MIGNVVVINIRLSSGDRHAADLPTIFIHSLTCQRLMDHHVGRRHQADGLWVEVTDTVYLKGGSLRLAPLVASATLSMRQLGP